MQYCPLQHWTLLLSPVTSTTGYCFYLGSIPSFFLELFLHWSLVAYWAPNGLGSSSFGILSFCLFILFMWSQGKNTEVACHSLLQWTNSLVAQLVKNLPTMQETWVQSLGWEDTLEKGKLPTPVFWPGEFHGIAKSQIWLEWLSLPLCNHKLFDLCHTWIVLVLFPTFFNLSLNFAIRWSWSEPQLASGLVFTDCIEFLYIWLQRI